MTDSNANIIARLESEIAEYRQELRDCDPSDRVHITLLKSTIENVNAKLSRCLRLETTAIALIQELKS